MIPRGFEAIGQAVEDRRRVVADFARLAMHQIRRADDSPAERLADCLVAEAHAEYWKFSGELANDIYRDARVFWRAGSGRDQKPFGVHFTNLADCDRVVTMHDDFSAQLAQVLNN